MKNAAKIVSAVSALAMLAALPVSALSVSAGVVGADQMSSGAYGVTNATINTGANVSGSANTTDVNVGVSGNANSNGGSSASDTSGSSGSSDVSANSNTDLSAPLIVTRADVDSNAVTASSATADSVRTKDDLSGYVAAQMKSDANVSSVDTASDHVALTYKEPAKLFGFIPVTIDTTATADASGNVTISYPWWAYLATKDNADVQAKVQDGVNATLGTNASATANANAQASAQLTAAQQAKLIASIKEALASGANASANASASGSVNQ
jgi:hypothetical protein